MSPEERAEILPSPEIEEDRRFMRRALELAEKARDDPVERESFDPFFTFFLGGLAAFDGETRVGAVGVSGLPGEVDEALARQALEAAGFSV